ncbi:hypothetical protein FKM82_022371 [Ascaphus truei]
MEQTPQVNHSADRDSAARGRELTRLHQWGRGAILGAQDRPWMTELLASGEFKLANGNPTGLRPGKLSPWQALYLPLGRHLSVCGEQRLCPTESPSSDLVISPSPLTFCPDT